MTSLTRQIEAMSPRSLVVIVSCTAHCKSVQRMRLADRLQTSKRKQDELVMPNGTRLLFLLEGPGLERQLEGKGEYALYTCNQLDWLESKGGL